MRKAIGTMQDDGDGCPYLPILRALIRKHGLARPGWQLLPAVCQECLQDIGIRPGCYVPKGGRLAVPDEVLFEKYRAIRAAQGIGRHAAFRILVADTERSFSTIKRHIKRVESTQSSC